MERKRTLKLSWDDLGDDDHDQFFDPRDRLSCAAPLDLATLGSDDSDDEFEDSRLSLSSAFSNSFRGLEFENHEPKSSSIMEDYGMWMADPGDIKERRKRLLQGMGLASNKDLLKVASTKIARAISRKPPDPGKNDKSSEKDESSKKDSKSNKDASTKDTSMAKATSTSPPEKPKQNKEEKDLKEQEEKEEEDPGVAPALPIVLVRSRSDGDIESFSADTKRRKEELIGPISKQRLTRTLSGLTTYRTGISQITGPVIVAPPKKRRTRSTQTGMTDECVGSFFLIKNLDTGKEFIVKECNEKGMWNKLSDLQTGKQLTMEEFEKHVGYSRIVKELMHRAHRRSDSKINKNSYISKSFRYSKKTSVALIRNIKGVANSMSMKLSEKERDPTLPVAQKLTKNSSEWIKVQQQGKTYKEFTGLQLCQEIQAHEGSIWTIKFSRDARYLASAGEDRVIHVWEVQDVEVIRPSSYQGGTTPLHPSLAGNSKGKTSTKKKENSIPDYVHMPETVFAFSEKPLCTLTGHQDEVLDLSWSKSQLLLSSSMDKTVRLWDIETKSCLKMFAHNDYVTCIQFNPTDDDYFISGSLDAKIRIWNVPSRKVVDWTDQKDMVTAICYTPDGESVIIGLQKGSCRLYRITDCKLEQEDQFDIEPKKKSQNKKITGFQFSKSNPSELLITSADSYIRIQDGTNFTHKFRGFKITTSQISASFSQDGKYVICASEDSQVYVWKREEVKSVGGKPPRCVTVQAREHFPCKDVSAAISWPRSTKNEPPPLVEMGSKRQPSKRSLPPPFPASGSPIKDESPAGTSKSNLPPLPKKNSMLERASSHQQEDESDQPSDTDSAVGPSESFASGSSSIRHGDSPSISASSSTPSQSRSSSLNLSDSGNTQGGNAIHATAWGMVIVTASSGGEIRVYQNFGLPVKANRQTNLFIA